MPVDPSSIPDPAFPWYKDVNAILKILEKVIIIVGMIIAAFQANKASQHASTAAVEAQFAREQSEQTERRLIGMRAPQ